MADSSSFADAASTASDQQRRAHAPRRWLPAFEMGGLPFLAAVAIVGAVSAGSLFAAGFVLLMPPKAVLHPTAPPALSAQPSPPAARAHSLAPPTTPPIAAAAVAAPRPAAKPSPPPTSPTPPPANQPPSAAAAVTAPPPAAKPSPPRNSLAAPPASSADIAFALAQGDADFTAGTVSVARFYYLEAADAGSAVAALRLGETFDPAYLTHRPYQATGDPAAARFWYRRALGLGAAAAQERLAALDAEPEAARAPHPPHRYWHRRYEPAASRSAPTFHQILEGILHPHLDILHPPSENLHAPPN